MKRVATLGMYDFPWLREATDALWAELRERLRAAGMADVPDALDRTRSLREIWRDPALLLAQTCGYPLVTELSGLVQVVATPIYDFPGCEGVLHRSFVVVRGDEPARSLAAMRGRRCAINGRDSNTGMNLLRVLVAPLAGGRRFFSEVIETGAHLESLRAVREGRADVAAIDCVTFGLASRHQPALLVGIRVLTETTATPGLPFVTSITTPTTDLAALRYALAGTVGGPAGAAVGVLSIEILDVMSYASVVALEREALATEYGTLA